MIHKTAIIDSKAKVSSSVKIGPYTVIGPNVEIGDDVIIHSHVNISGNTKIGNGTIIFPFASIGNVPQDLKYKGEDTKLEVGKNNKIREYVTISPGTKGGGGLTKIGDNCLFMAYVHVAHDCNLKNDIILANGVQLGGHVNIDNYGIIGGMTPVHQFCRIGTHAFVGGGLRVVQDVPPYIIANGEPLKFSGINILGLRRRKFSSDKRNNIKKVYKLIYSSNYNLSQATQKIKDSFDCNDSSIKDIIEFLKSSTRGLI